MSDTQHWATPMRVSLAQGSKAEKGFRRRATMPTPAAIAPGVPPTPEHDLLFHGGKLLPDLEYVNFYVGGSNSWPAVSRSSSVASMRESMLSDKHSTKRRRPFRAANLNHAALFG